MADGTMITSLGFDHGEARKAAEFSASVIPDSQVGAAHKAPSDYPDGEESACGWCKDRWGFSWQITPRVLLDATTSPDQAAAKRAFDAMMPMQKIDVATIEAAFRGEAVDA
jgi:predicted 3-demethylubiquinone-9 3-methyltransferase (glyoxalase superfamily)